MLSNKTLGKIALIARRIYFPGLERILKRLSNYEKPGNAINAVVPYRKNLKIALNTSSFIEWQVFWRGGYEKRIADILEKDLKPGDVAVDVGANIGIHTLVMAKAVGELGRVIAFEPYDEVAERLAKNIEINGFKNTKILRVALSNFLGEQTLYTPDATSNKGNASLFREAHMELSGEVKVQIKTLDEVMRECKLNRLDFLKIDIEGGEFNALLGGKESINIFRPRIIFEFYEKTWAGAGYSWKDAQKFFENLNYELKFIDQSNVYARPKE